MVVSTDRVFVSPLIMAVKMLVRLLIMALKVLISLLLISPRPPSGVLLSHADREGTAGTLEDTDK